MLHEKLSVNYFVHSLNLSIEYCISTLFYDLWLIITYKTLSIIFELVLKCIILPTFLQNKLYFALIFFIFSYVPSCLKFEVFYPVVNDRCSTIFQVENLNIGFESILFVENTNKLFLQEFRFRLYELFGS
jgi:hypothetical protein